jgi:PAS domain S-box-containing protein
LLKGKIIEQAYSKYEYRITGTIRDISAQKEAELAVQESEMRFRSVLEASNDAIAILLNDITLVYWNKKATALFGYAQDELFKVGGFTQLFAPDDWHKFYRILSGAMLNSEQTTVEISMKNANNMIIPALVTITPILIKREVNLVLTIKDLSTEIKAMEEKKKLEEQLRHAQKMETIGTLAGGIAHDFNNILTPILGYTQMAMSDLPDQSPLLEDLQHVYKAAGRARDLVKQILTFSRRLETEKLVIFAHLIINEVVGLITATIPTNIRINKKIHAKNDQVFIAPTQLHQVIMNICTNAYQAMKEDGGVLTIELDVLDQLSIEETSSTGLASGQYVRMKIGDTGKGIDPSIMSRIFEPFFTTKSVGEGTGLGLSVAHGIIKDSNGSIQVKSTINFGTEFTVYLPKSKEETTEIKTSKSGFDAKKYKAILVDDDNDVLSLLKKVMLSMGFYVSDFIKSENARQFIQKDIHSFDLLITDQIMPDVQGIDLVKLAKELKPGIKTILITGYSAGLTDENAKKSGVDKFLLKPIIIDNFAETLAQIFS